MIKLTLTGTNPTPLWVNPAHLVEFFENLTTHACTVRLTNGNSYVVSDAGQNIQDQVIAWQHRTHQ